MCAYVKKKRIDRRQAALGHHETNNVIVPAQPFRAVMDVWVRKITAEEQRVVCYPSCWLFCAERDKIRATPLVQLKDARELLVHEILNHVCMNIVNGAAVCGTLYPRKQR